MEDYRDLLNLRKNNNIKKNVICVWTKWDSNDADYIEKTFIVKPENLFSNKKLIYCLAYISCGYNFKGHGWNDDVFEHHVTDNTDIVGLKSVLNDFDIIPSTDWGYCHSCYDFDLKYYDANGQCFNICFDKIIDKWRNMTYEEICKEINDIEYE